MPAPVPVHALVWFGWFGLVGLSLWCIFHPPPPTCSSPHFHTLPKLQMMCHQLVVKLTGWSVWQRHLLAGLPRLVTALETALRPAKVGPAPCATLHGSCFMCHAAWVMLHVSRCMGHASAWATLHGSCFTCHAAWVMLLHVPRCMGHVACRAWHCTSPPPPPRPPSCDPCNCALLAFFVCATPEIHFCSG